MSKDTEVIPKFYNGDACQSLVDDVRVRFDFDFTGLSIVDRQREHHLTWRYVSGNANNRYQRIVLSPGFGVIGTVYETGQPYVIQDIKHDIPRSDLHQYPIAAAEGLTSFFAIPLWGGDNLSAVLLCAYRMIHEIDTSLVEQVGHFIESRDIGLTTKAGKPLFAEQPQAAFIHDELAHRVIQAQEAERKRIARELHDGLAQEILLVQMELRKLAYLPQEAQSEAIEKATLKLGEVLVHVKSIASGLCPLLLDDLGLASAISAHCDLLQPMFGVRITLDVEEEISLQEDVEMVFFRVFQEAALNACKYSQSETIGISFHQREGSAELIVRDYGVGFDVEKKYAEGGGLGLEGMSERAELVGGELCVDSSSRGTEVTLKVPLERS